GLVAAPCAGPVVVALMTFIASTGRVILGFTLMVAFAAGMGILFIILGTFSGLLSALPSAGMWMNKVKKAFGVIMLAAALFIAKPLIPPPVFGVLIGVGLVLLGAALGAFRSITPDDSVKKDLVRGIALILAVWGMVCLAALLPVPGKIVPVQPVDGGVAESGTASESIWMQDVAAGLKAAGTSGQYVILDFGAEWCHACKELEHKTFNDPAVVARLKDMVAVKVDCTNGRDPAIRAVQQDYGVTGLPTVIVLDSQGIEAGRFVSFLPPKQFLTFLDQAVGTAID
ncbi:thioredoxin family protein, partial [bacterium]|nr:thioredoxin family protein [candidate division CSSED10-310 bacterium]